MAEVAGTSSEMLPEYFTGSISNEVKTGLRLFTLEDSRTSVAVTFPEPNSKRDVPMTFAWGGARTSRNPQLRTTPEVYEEMEEALMALSDDDPLLKGYTAGQKFEIVFGGYGHASIGDMAPIMLHLDRLTAFECFWLFNHLSVGGGQEFSTRYSQLEDLGIPPLLSLMEAEVEPDIAEDLEASWLGLQGFLLGRYEQWQELLNDPLVDYVMANKEPEDKLQKSTREARVLDVARYWLPGGVKASFAYLASARNWIDLTSQLKSSGDKRLRHLGEQITHTLLLKEFKGFEDIQAELRGLTKPQYYEGSNVIQRNREAVGDYVREALNRFRAEMPEASDEPLVRPHRVKRLEFKPESDALLFQYIMVEFPDLDEQTVIDFIDYLDDKELEEISKLIFADHTHHQLMRNVGDIRGVTVMFEAAWGLLRDLNRHRAMGRLVLSLETGSFERTLGEGFEQNFQIANADYWKHLGPKWEADAEEFYRLLFDFHKRMKDALGEDYNSSILFNILPFGHRTKMFMSGPPSQWSYMTSLRSAGGGDFGYMRYTQDALRELRKDPLFRGMATHTVEPDPNSIKQILMRG